VISALLAGYPPKASGAALVNSLKDMSARMMRQRYRIRAAASILVSLLFRYVLRGAPQSVIRQYVEQQPTPSSYPPPNAAACAANFPV
jgi:putative transposase